MRERQLKSIFKNKGRRNDNGNFYSQIWVKNVYTARDVT